ncbi:MAG: c-type cytochrome [Acidobacteria bacterium]|nr:c-type cytochrome [Acidobacteriota bacterium]
MAVKPEPGRDPAMAERTLKLNLVFALTSIGLLLTLSLMVWYDYDREWKRYQVEFNKIEVELTEKQIEEALGKVGVERKRSLEAQIAEGERQVASRRAEVRAAEKEYEALDGTWYAVDQNHRFTKAKIDVARYEYDEAVHGRSKSAASRLEHLRKLEAQWQTYRLELEDVIAQRDAAAAKVREVKKAFLDAEAAAKETLGQLTRLEERLTKIQPGFVTFARNLPILDMANPSLKVNQVMPANLYDDVVFTPTPKVDRCTTCHLGIDKKGYETARQPFTTHPNLELYLQGPHPIDKVGCTVCHQGRGRATGFQKAAHVPSTKEQEKAWGKYTKSAEYHALHYWDLPMMAKGTTESQCAKCHRDVVEVPRADRLNVGIQLVERYGCFGCHKIKGWENLRKVGPDLTKILSKTDEAWIYRWIKEPRAFRPTRMPQVWGVRVNTYDDAGQPVRDTPEQEARNAVEANAVVAYLTEKSTRDRFPDPPKGDLTAGRKAFEAVGCLACHRIGDDKRGVDSLVMASFRTHGPNLDGTGSKVNAGWLYAWIRNPKGYWHDTRMPNLRLTEREAADVTAYLMSLENEEFEGRPRPPLDGTLRDTLVREYLLALQTVKQADQKLAAMGDKDKTLFLGEKTIARYGCFGCHTIAGFEKTSPIGVELTEQGSKVVERLDFGFEHDIPHTLPGWLHRKLMEPRVFDRDKEKKPDELLRMPKFHLASDEADAMVTAIMSLTKEQVPLAAQKRLSADERYVEQGRRLVRSYNCQGCHVVGAKGGAIKAVIQDLEEKRLAAEGKDVEDGRFRAPALSPPILFNDKSQIGEGARVQTAWLHAFLKDPSEQVRPWLQVRMPTFEFAEEDLNAITRYFAAQDDVPYPYEPQPEIPAATLAAGRDLFAKWQCVSCHVVAGRLPQGKDVADMAPDLANVPRRLRTDWLAKWLADPQRIMPGTKMPANFPEDPQMNAFPEILGGDQRKQIEAVRAYLLTLGGRGFAAGAQ